MRSALTLTLALLATPAAAQQFTDAESGILRWLDKLTGETADIELLRGQEAVSGRLTIRLDACRYPSDNPTSDAEAHLTISEAEISTPVFDGWMIASSPGLSALDHPRYDVWVLRCVTPEPPPQAEVAPDPNADPNAAPATSPDDGQ
jgi:hypothetical protein